MTAGNLQVLRLALYYGSVAAGGAGLVLAVPRLSRNVSAPVTILISVVATFAGGAASWISAGIGSDGLLIFGIPVLACAAGLGAYVVLAGLSVERSS